MTTESSCPAPAIVLAAVAATVISSDSNGQKQSIVTNKQTTIATDTKRIFSSGRNNRYEGNANADKSDVACCKNNIEYTGASDINKIVTDHQDYGAEQTLLGGFLHPESETLLGASAFCDNINSAQVKSYIIGKVNAGELEVSGASQFIDSCSILRNKEKLKRFWEHKMEMDFRLHQQQQEQLQMNGERRKNAKQKLSTTQQESHLQAGKDKQQKQVQLNKALVTFDENNNNGGDVHDKDEDFAIKLGDGATEDSDVKKLNGKASQFSDEDRRSSLSNERQADGNSTFNNRPIGGEQVVGSRDSNGDNQMKHQVSSELVCEKLSDYRAKDSSNDNSSTDSGAKTKTTGQEPARQKASIREQQPVGEVGREDSGQLMSIDPTLCRSDDHHQVHAFDEDEEEISSNFECEEQTANEEFSSSSSSFGPISISLARQDTEAETQNGEMQSKPNLSSPADDEEPNSNLSGSVATVIRMPAEGESNREPGDSEMVKNTVVDNTDEEDYSSSNIGVAFESLQFDDEIKSSKQELVDQEHLIASQPVANSTPLKRVAAGNRFNAKEVKTVCNLITAAISDATKQVESFMSRTDKQLDASSAPQQPVEQPEVSDHEGSIQRATYVQESSSAILSPTTTDADSEADKVACDVSQATNTSGKSTNSEGDHNGNIPKADLSSIFEASVRREIERFEANSMLRRSAGAGGNKLQAANNGLTEWRIAEEIRSFNEREMELKCRLKESGARPAANQQVAPHLDNCESIVRFGKTFHIPKSTTLGGVASSYDTTPAAHLSKSIKLSTTAVNSQSNNNNNNSSPTTTISMHKFISSGGKRFVYTNTAGGIANGQPCSPQNLLTKSMTNISLCGTRQCEQPARPVDYKAVDSLTQKETPNVKPGLTRKVIETFSRMNTGSNDALSPLASIKSNVRQDCQQMTNHQNTAAASVSVPPTAEWKIQEELREMRAREAELRDQRRFTKSKRAVSASVDGDPDDSSSKPNELIRGSMRDTEGEVDGCVKSSTHTYTITDNQKSADRLSFSSESLYPIKQAIDSFRKLNSTQSVTNPPKSHLQTHIQSKIQRIHHLDSQSSTNAENDCRSSAPGGNSNGHRKKTPMIERWESRGH